MKQLHKDTQIVHGTRTVHTTSMDLVAPIHMTATFRFENSDFGASVFKGEQEGFIYSRISNPTVALLEEKMALLEGAEAGLATASGMSAIAAVAMTLAGSGDNLVACTTLYGGTFALFAQHLGDFHIESRLLSPFQSGSAAELEKHIDAKTRFLFIETPANPTLQILDIALWASIAEKHGIPLIVDNTFASPYLQNPLQMGAHLVVHSATKYLGGHGDVVGGLSAGSREMIGRIRNAYTGHFGPAMSPFNAWLFLRGIKTLALRMERHSENAMKIAEWLQAHPKVRKVHYPGLTTHPGHNVAKKQMKKFGGMMAFEIKGGVAAGKRFMDALQLCILAVSLGDCETLVQHPATMTHSTYAKSEREKAGIPDGLIRLSAGIEAADDIIADLQAGLSVI